MPRIAYQQALADLHHHVLELGALVERRLEQGINALVRHDLATGSAVQSGDGDIDRGTWDIERNCIELMTLQQPVAGDIRLIAAHFKTVTDLERIGDLAVNLADYAGDGEALQLIDTTRIARVGKTCLEMLGDALQAYADLDTARAEAVVLRDDELDDLCWVTIRAFLEASHKAGRQAKDDEAAKRHAEEALPVLLSMRDLERAGDHAVNIAARVLFIVDGETTNL